MLNSQGVAAVAGSRFLTKCEKTKRGGLDNTIILCIIKIWTTKRKNRNVQVVVLGRFIIAES